MNVEVKRLLKRIFPIEWLRKIKRIKEDVDLIRIGKVTKHPFEPGLYPYGVNVIGPINQPSGIGQSMWLVIKELEAATIPYCIVDFNMEEGDRSSQNRDVDAYAADTSNALKYAINLWHVQMHEFTYLYHKFAKAAFDMHYNVAFWVWEMNSLPARWKTLFNLIDEIWCPSEFATEAFRKETTSPVVSVPFHVEVKSNISLTRADFNLSEDTFLFLQMYDFKSASKRKNPDAVIEAFKKAFPIKADKTSEPKKKEPKKPHPALVIKINHPTEEELASLKDKLEGYPVCFITETLAKEDVNRLIELADVYVSLHRSEGFGLTLAESMALGTPTIATNYSGNLEYQTSENACLVGYREVSLKRDYSLYERGDTWADADTDEAAQYMRRLYEEKSFREEISKKARDDIEEKLGIRVQMAILRERCEKAVAKS